MFSCNYLKALILILIAVLTASSDLTLETTSADELQESVWRLREREDLGDVWNGVSVGFAFLKRPDALYVGFYSYDRSMTIGKRSYDSDSWEFKTLPTKISWDSHNYVTMSFDSKDRLHVSGNMHCVPIIYFRATEPNDIQSLVQVKSMTGDREGRATYPRFMNDKNGRMIFTYRDGSSGNGDQIWNVYDETTDKWSRLLDKPLFNGKGLMNAYFVGPTLGADGYFHVAWVWRDTPDCATNHDLSYARSPDLIHWEKSTGEPYELPISLETGEIVEPIPVKGGLLNPLVRLSFDQKGRVVLTYSKYDDQGRLQIWVSRLEESGWRRAPVTDWDFVWNFQGGGSIPGELNFDGARVASPNVLAVGWDQTVNKKRGTAFLDAETLQPCAAPNAPQTGAKIPEYSKEDAAALNKVESDDARLGARSQTIDVNGERWVFRWETPGPNRDQPQPDGAPEPTKLRVFKFERRQ